ncbi:hypothetical protein KW801_01655, partial [Candidatus Saccharibacteria bacterium]|nr:hypothetical protein [Candidatus Saccharibacteria bacterium]
TPVAWSDIHFTNDRILQFEKVLHEVCSKNNIPHVATFEALKDKMDSTKLFTDGLHPNNEGHQLIFELIQPELDKLLNT